MVIDVLGSIVIHPGSWHIGIGGHAKNRKAIPQGTNPPRKMRWKSERLLCIDFLIFTHLSVTTLEIHASFQVFEDGMINVCDLAKPGRIL